MWAISGTGCASAAEHGQRCAAALGSLSSRRLAVCLAKRRVRNTCRERTLLPLLLGLPSRVTAEEDDRPRCHSSIESPAGN